MGSKIRPRLQNFSEKFLSAMAMAGACGIQGSKYGIEGSNENLQWRTQMGIEDFKYGIEGITLHRMGSRAAYGIDGTHMIYEGTHLGTKG